MLICRNICCCSVPQLCWSLCDPIDCSTPGLPVPHHLPEFSQVHVHYIGDAIQPSHPLMPSSPSTLNLAQHQGLFQWVVCSHQMTKHWSFSISPYSEYSFYLPTNAVQGSQFFHILANTYLFCFLVVVILPLPLIVGRCYLILVLICISLLISDVKCLFLCLLLCVFCVCVQSCLTLLGPHGL